MTNFYLNVRQLSAVLFTILTVACSSSKHVGDAYVTYEDRETGWSTRYPASWELVEDADAAATEARGVKKIETTVNRKVDMDHTRLLWIRNGPKNSLNSNKMVYKFSSAAAYNDNYKRIYEIVIKTQEREGLKFDYKYGSMMIDGLEFQTFEMTIYSKSGSVAGHQLVCTRYINGRIGLLININFTSEKNKEILMAVLMSSKFSIRD